MPMSRGIDPLEYPPGIGDTKSRRCQASCRRIDLERQANCSESAAVDTCECTGTVANVSFRGKHPLDGIWLSGSRPR